MISWALCDACTRRVRDPKSKAVPLAASCPSPPFLTFLFSFSLENESCRCVTTDPRHLVKIPRSNSPSAHFPSAGVNADGQVPRCQLAWFTEVRYVLRVKYSDDGASSKAICAICCRCARVSLCVHKDSSFVAVLFSTWNTHRVRIITIFVSLITRKIRKCIKCYLSVTR